MASETHEQKPAASVGNEWVAARATAVSCAQHGGQRAAAYSQSFCQPTVPH
jgi:hypothetical protein